MKQSSIEWFINELDKTIPYQHISNSQIFTDIIEQAKAMHKEEQREDMIGLLEWMNEIAKTDPMQLETDKDDIVDMYFNETYGGTK
jgi:hypothetical protein